MDDKVIQTGQSPAVSRLPTHLDRHRLKLLSYNIQVAVSSTRARHYFTKSWKHVLPHPTSFDTLDGIGRIVSDYDIVGLQEADGGSLRSYFVNQVEYLAERGRFPYWYHQTNRNLGKFAQHSNGLLSRHKPSDIIEHKLPGFIPGRGALVVSYGAPPYEFVIVLVHLALGRRARQFQLDFISEIVNEYDYVCVMGDFNCTTHSAEMVKLFNKTDLRSPEDVHLTFPSWRSWRNIDHILTSSKVQVNEVSVLNQTLSDHLPIAMDITLPGRWQKVA